MKKEFEKLLALLPECACSTEALSRGAEYFSLEPKSVQRAAELLPEYHDLKYRGVRLLLSACLQEFADMFSAESRQLCQVTVPAPTCAIYAIQAAAKHIRFGSPAFFAQIVLRGILLDKRPIDPAGCAKRHCGLNTMRRRLLEEPPMKAPEYQLQFGVLCDECVKAGEAVSREIKTLSVCLPGGAGTRALAEDFFESVCKTLGAKPGREAFGRAFGLYCRLLAAETRIENFCRREEREPLWGNSLALAQSVLLLCPDKPERFIEALEELAGELENAPPVKAAARLYCFYVPFLQPEIDAQFRENSVCLTGGAAFLQRKGRPGGFSLAGMTESWLSSMLIKADTTEQCAAIAGAVRDWNCRAYLTGSFAFDRRLGALLPLQRKILKAYNIDVKSLDADFWCENAMFGSWNQRIDQLCIG